MLRARTPSPSTLGKRSTASAAPARTLAATSTPAATPPRPRGAATALAKSPAPEQTPRVPAVRRQPPPLPPTGPRLATAPRRSPPPLPVRARAITLSDSDLEPCEPTELTEVRPMVRTPAPAPMKSARTKRMPRLGTELLALGAAFSLFVYALFVPVAQNPLASAQASPAPSAAPLPSAVTSPAPLHAAVEPKLQPQAKAKPRTHGAVSAPAKKVHGASRGVKPLQKKPGKAKHP